MISIIVSSYQKKYFDNFCKNVEETIGVPYEIIDIWNPGKMGICEAYNLGASKAKFPNLVFCHEDILFHTNNWGKIIVEQLNNDKIGVIGVAGSNYVPKSPSGWFIHNSNYNKINIIQHRKGHEPKKENTLQNHLENVFAVDGVFMAIDAKKYLKIKFNEDLKGFHAYDLDFSLRSAQKCQNYVTNNILIEHFSFGNPDQSWFENTCKVRENINYNYPQTIDDTIETETYNRYLHLLFRYYSVNSATIIKALKGLPKWSFINLKEVLHFVKNKDYYNKKNGHA